MKKKLISSLATFFCISGFSFAQENFDFQTDDDFFGNDSIIQIEDTQTGNFSDEVNHGSLFEAGNVKVGGKFSTGMEILAPLYKDDETEFFKRLGDTILTPKAEASLFVDARPTQILRMYTKFDLAYPFETTASSSSSATTYQYGSSFLTGVSTSTSVSDYLSLKELFTDFSVADRVFFRFGKHTVSWGTGYFFSPVSDMINTSMIDPEDTDSQVDGSLNLRTQVTFTNRQDCLWFYIIPSTDFLSASSTSSYLKETALAAKYEAVLGSWELGAGGFYRFEDSPKAMLTASGSIIKGKIGVFGEAVYQCGTQYEWSQNKTFSEKTNLFFLTAGLNYYWKTPQITFAAQYYYDSFNDENFDIAKAYSQGAYYDIVHNYFTKGHNVAAAVNFARIFGTTDFSASLFAMMNFGKAELSSSYKEMLSSGASSESYLNALTVSGILNYTPFKNLTLGFGPYVSLESWQSKPIVNAKLTASLGGGKF